MKIRWNLSKNRKRPRNARSPFASTSAEASITMAHHSWNGLVSSKFESILSFLNIWFQIRGQFIFQRVNWNSIRSAIVVFLASYLFASATSAYVANKSFKNIAKSKPATLSEEALELGASSAGQSRSSTSSMRDLILQRNVFNSAGILAPDGSEKNTRKSDDQNFESSACTQEQLPVQIVGTIFTGNAKESVVIIKDSQIPDADIYKPGMVIIDHEDFEIYKVKQGVVEIRKGDQKICVDLTGRSPVDQAAQTGAPKPEASESIDIADDEMKTLLGPELARAMNEVKLIPLPAPGGPGIQGFQILALVPGSIYDRVKLQNEDIVVEVNGQSLKDPTQGYRLLESLQQQREITINFTRNGEPMVRKVRVK